MEPFIYDINNYVDRIFYINMDKSIERNENIIKQFKKHDIWNYERISGITIENVPEIHGIQGPFNENTDKEKYIKGAIGCLLSHKKIIEIAVVRNYSKICIFEDDINFIENFKEGFNSYAQNLNSQNPGYQIAYLGLINDYVDPDPNIKIEKVHNHAYGTHGYIINNLGWVYQYILQNIDFVFQEIDLLYNSMILQNCLSDCYVCVPNLVTQNMNFESNINDNKK